MGNADISVTHSIRHGLWWQVDILQTEHLDTVLVGIGFHGMQQDISRHDWVGSHVSQKSTQLILDVIFSGSVRDDCHRLRSCSMTLRRSVVIKTRHALFSQRTDRKLTRQGRRHGEFRCRHLPRIHGAFLGRNQSRHRQHFRHGLVHFINCRRMQVRRRVLFMAATGQDCSPMIGSRRLALVSREMTRNRSLTVPIRRQE